MPVGVRENSPDISAGMQGDGMGRMPVLAIWSRPDGQLGGAYPAVLLVVQTAGLLDGVFGLQRGVVTIQL